MTSRSADSDGDEFSSSDDDKKEKSTTCDRYVPINLGPDLALADNLPNESSAVGNIPHFESDKLGTSTDQRFPRSHLSTRVFLHGDYNFIHPSDNVTNRPLVAKIKSEKEMKVFLHGRYRNHNNNVEDDFYPPLEIITEYSNEPCITTQDHIFHPSQDEQRGY